MNLPADTQRWMQHGLCTQTGGEAFYVDKGDSKALARAKHVCEQCEVIEQCLEYALAHHERFGVWGGLSDRERQRIARQRIAAARQVA